MLPLAFQTGYKCVMVTLRAIDTELALSPGELISEKQGVNMCPRLIEFLFNDAF
jgi:hypothetical protein